MADIDSVLDQPDVKDPSDIYDERELLGDDNDTQNDSLLNDNDSVNSKDIKQDVDSDLFDAVLETSTRESITSNTSKGERDRDSKTRIQLHGNYKYANLDPESKEKVRRYCVFVANMTWWTTDDDLRKKFNEIGISDENIVDIKFYDHRSNGQSKGYALVVLEKEPDQRLAIDKINGEMVFGQKVECVQYSKSAQSKFETMTMSSRPQDRMRTEQRIQQIQGGGGNQSTSNSILPHPNLNDTTASSASSHGSNYLGAVRIGMNGRVERVGQPAAQPAMRLLAGTHVATPQPLVSATPQMQYQPLYSQPPPMQTSRPPPSVYSSAQPLMRPAPQPLMSQPPPNLPQGAYVNPSVYPHLAPQQVPTQQHLYAGGRSSAGSYGQPSNQTPVSEAEFDEIMNRNRTVSSSAISRAVSDAAAGDYGSAIETLVTAMGLINQSRVANDDRCRVLVSSLRDTLSGIEAKSYGNNSRSRKHRSSRSPSRKRHRHNSRSRSRSPGGRYERDRYSPRTRY